ncbi:hypothetical protein ACLB2K_025409 [Fragaria x ananassa]
MSLGAISGAKGQEEGSFVRVNKIMDIASLEKFLQKRIKVSAMAGALSDSVSVTREKNKITVTSDSTFSNVPIYVECNSRYLLLLRLSFSFTDLAVLVWSCTYLDMV